MLQHFSDLDDTLAVGSHPHTPEQIQWLREVGGVRALVTLQSDEDLASRGLSWGVLWQLYMRAGISTTRVPVRDFDRKDLERHLEAAVDAVAQHVAAGRKVYVHCTAGLNRSPSVVIGYLAAHRGMTLDEATAWVSERHSCMPYPDVLAAWARARGLT